MSAVIHVRVHHQLDLAERLVASANQPCSQSRTDLPQYDSLRNQPMWTASASATRHWPGGLLSAPNWGGEWL